MVQDDQERRALASWDALSWGPVGDLLSWMRKGSWTVRGPGIFAMRSGAPCSLAEAPPACMCPTTS
eukprot:6319079-Pyramimonas_sp.AAC.1